MRPAAIVAWPTPAYHVRALATPTAGVGHLCFYSELTFGNCLSEVVAMSSAVKSLKVTYNPINETNTFTNGETVSGQVTLEVAKDYQISSLSVKFKGKARVKWSEHYGQTTVAYHAKEKYFTIKHYFVHDKKPEGE